MLHRLAKLAAMFVVMGGTMRTLKNDSCCLTLMRACFMSSTEGCVGGGWGEPRISISTPVCVCRCEGVCGACVGVLFVDVCEGGN